MNKIIREGLLGLRSAETKEVIQVKNSYVEYLGVVDHLVTSGDGSVEPLDVEPSDEEAFSLLRWNKTNLVTPHYYLGGGVAAYAVNGTAGDDNEKYIILRKLNGHRGNEALQISESPNKNSGCLLTNLLGEFLLYQSQSRVMFWNQDREVPGRGRIEFKDVLDKGPKDHFNKFTSNIYRDPEDGLYSLEIAHASGMFWTVDDNFSFYPIRARNISEGGVTPNEKFHIRALDSSSNDHFVLHPAINATLGVTFAGTEDLGLRADQSCFSKLETFKLFKRARLTDDLVNNDAVIIYIKKEKGWLNEDGTTVKTGPIDRMNEDYFFIDRQTCPLCLRSPNTGKLIQRKKSYVELREIASHLASSGDGSTEPFDIEDSGEEGFSVLRWDKGNLLTPFYYYAWGSGGVAAIVMRGTFKGENEKFIIFKKLNEARGLEALQISESPNEKTACLQSDGIPTTFQLMGEFLVYQSQSRVMHWNKQSGESEGRMEYIDVIHRVPNGHFNQFTSRIYKDSADGLYSLEVSTASKVFWTVDEKFSYYPIRARSVSEGAGITPNEKFHIRNLDADHDDMFVLHPAINKSLGVTFSGTDDLGLRANISCFSQFETFKLFKRTLSETDLVHGDSLIVYSKKERAWVDDNGGIVRTSPIDRMNEGHFNVDRGDGRFALRSAESGELIKREKSYVAVRHIFSHLAATGHGSAEPLEIRDSDEEGFSILRWNGRMIYPVYKHPLSSSEVVAFALDGKSLGDNEKYIIFRRINGVRGKESLQISEPPNDKSKCYEQGEVSSAPSHRTGFATGLPNFILGSLSLGLFL
eukprot:GHVN01067236.1.p1 GENE.GHVN01067236.1~~GHVN01067236.1.p1  ORF type:complete len:809 (+),score=55.91 GHVN01067236.1:349-2775(+)